MAEAEGNKKAKDYGVDIPQKNVLFELKGSNNYDWGMKDRLSRVFNPKSGRTVMLAFDHGYIMGPTSGLERIDLTIVPILQYADCLMCTQGRAADPGSADGQQAHLAADFRRYDRPHRIER